MTDWQDRIIETRSGDPAELVKMLHPDNPKSHPEAQMEGIEHSLNKVGWIDRPIWNRHTNYFLDGNGRVKLALMAGQTSIKYDVVDLSPEEERYVLATFDALVGMAETDAVKLLALVNEVGEDLPEAVSEHLLGMIGEVEEPPGNGAGGDVPPQVDKAEELREKYNTQPNQIWQLGKHKIACVDSTDEETVKRLTGGESVQMVWSDPPYGINAVDVNSGQTGGLGRQGATGYPFGGVKAKGKGVTTRRYAPVMGDTTTETAMKSLELLFRIIPNSIQIWWGANHYASALPNSRCWLVWDKETDGFFADCELAWCSFDGAIRKFVHKWSGLIKASEHGQRRVHPTQKPIALAEWAFEKYGKPNDLIFDPFLGSGISLIAAENLNDGRWVIGCELAPEYIAVIIERWHQLTGLEPVLLEE